nr:hypothetical protein KPHV_19040 [Kitasatospora purpeofusca]
MGGLAHAVHRDGVEPVRDPVADGALRVDHWDAPVAGGLGFGELVHGLLAGPAVDVEALAVAVGGEDVGGGFPAAVLALEDGSFAVGAVLLLGCHQAASSSREATNDRYEP